MDEYIKQVDYLNGDRATYTYYLQQDGIKLSPEGYAIGKEGNETEYFGQFVMVSVEDDGYLIGLQRVSEVVNREKVSQRQRIVAGRGSIYSSRYGNRYQRICI